jgi:hypothetical protein
MALPEYLVPILAAGGPIASVIVILRFGPDAVLRLLAGAVAVFTSDEKRGQRCLEVLRILRNKTSSPPQASRRRIHLERHQCGVWRSGPGRRCIWRRP